MVQEKIKVLIISGPTAVGKSAFGVKAAQLLNGEVISADSMQIYRGMDIGTGKITASEMHGIKHHMLDVADPDEDYSVGQYVYEAANLIKRYRNQRKIAYNSRRNRTVHQFVDVWAQFFSNAA